MAPKGAKDPTPKPGNFLPMINEKKKPAVGLFGDYETGDDAMLVYDVDSDAEEDPFEKKAALKSIKKKQSIKKLPRMPETERNVVVPNEEE